MTPVEQNPVDLAVGERIRTERLKRGMSQGDLATTLGVSAQQVQKYEKGINCLSAGRLHAIAQAFEMPVDFFFHDPITKADTGEVVGLGHRTSESIRLNLAFLRIVDPRFRRHIVDLVQSIADAVSEEAQH